MKWIITADLHCYNSHLYSLPVYNGVPLPGELEFLREKPYWHLLTDRMIDSLRILHHIYSLADRGGIERIYHLGDLFHKKTPGIALAVMIDVLNEFAHCFADVEFFLLPGNHDAFKAWSYLSALVTPRAITLLSNPQVERVNKVEVYAIPYTARMSDWNDTLGILLASESKKGTRQMLLFHQDVLGVQLPSGHELKSGVDLDNITRYFDVWFAGHIHVHNPTMRGACVGSALPINFTDAGADHGYILFDPVSCHWQFKPFPEELIPGFSRTSLGDIKRVSKLRIPSGTEYLWVDVLDPKAKRTHMDRIKSELEKFMRYVYVTQPSQVVVKGSAKMGAKEKKKMFIDKRYAIAEWAKEKGLDPEIGLEIYDQVSSA